MSAISNWKRWAGFLVLGLLTMPVAAQTSAPVRVALWATTLNADSEKYLDVAVAELTARGGIELVERQAIRRVLDEQSQALQQDSSGVAVGKLLRADVIGVLETTPDGKEAGGFAVLDMADFQGTSVMNECDGEVPWTRTHEFKHFTPELSFERTVIFREYSFDPGSEDDLYYPVRTAADLAIHAKYIKEAAGVPHVHFGGRLGAYAYLDMENTVSTALEQYERLRAEGGSAPGGA